MSDWTTGPVIDFPVDDNAFASQFLWGASAAAFTDVTTTAPLNAYPGHWSMPPSDLPWGSFPTYLQWLVNLPASNNPEGSASEWGVSLKYIREQIMAVNDTMVPSPPSGFILEWESPHGEPAGPLRLDNVHLDIGGGRHGSPGALGSVDWYFGYRMDWVTAAHIGAFTYDVAAPPALATIPYNASGGVAGWEGIGGVGDIGLPGFTSVLSGTVNLDTDQAPGSDYNTDFQSVGVGSAPEFVGRDWLQFAAWDSYLLSGVGPPWLGEPRAEWSTTATITQYPTSGPYIPRVRILGQMPRYRYLREGLAPPLFQVQRQGGLDGHAYTAVQRSTRQSSPLQAGML